VLAFWGLGQRGGARRFQADRRMLPHLLPIPPAPQEFQEHAHPPKASPPAAPPAGLLSSYPHAQRFLVALCLRCLCLTRVSHHDEGGRGLAPPFHDARNCFFVSRPAQFVGKSCAGCETSRGWKPAISAGLQPRPPDRREKGSVW
jgi:hypothetical protein